jgi:hypothetical protein
MTAISSSYEPQPGLPTPLQVRILSKLYAFDQTAQLRCELHKHDRTLRSFGPPKGGSFPTIDDPYRSDIHTAKQPKDGQSALGLSSLPGRF